MMKEFRCILSFDDGAINYHLGNKVHIQKKIWHILQPEEKLFIKLNLGRPNAKSIENYCQFTELFPLCCK